MARKIVKYVVQDEGRDKGKVFVITELPSARAERWALRAFLALSQNGVDIPDDVSKGGMGGLAAYGLSVLGHIPFAEAEVLFSEMFECIQIQPNPADQAIVRGLVPDDIEEISTRMKLRMEVFKLHVDFLLAGAPSTSGKVVPAGQ